MLKLKLGENQIFAIDENGKICKVFYNFNDAKEYIDRKNKEEADECYIAQIESWCYHDIGDFHSFTM